MIKDDYQAPSLNLVNPTPGMHLCFFYETKAELLNGVISYLKAGLDNHEFCLWVVSSQISPSEAINAFAETTPDVQQRIAAGDLEIIPHTDWYLKNGDFSITGTIEGWKSKLNQKIAKGYSSGRITGDVTWAIAAGWKEFSEYEKALDHEIRKLNISALCTYPLVNCKPDQVLDVVSSHQCVISERVGKLDVKADIGELGAESEYRRMSSNFDSPAADRTLELTHANEELKKEIAERQRAEQELRKREAQLSDAQSLAHLGSWEWDPHTGLADWSDELYRIWGVEPLNFSPTLDSIMALVHPDDRSALEADITKAVREEQPYIREHRIIRPDGSVRVLQSRGRPIVDENGTVFKLIGTGLDITERKQAESELRDSETLRRMIIESEPECVKLVSRGYLLLDVNPSGLNMIEADSPDQVIGKSVLDIVAEGSRDAYKALNDRVFLGETAVGEFEIVGLKGTHRWMESHAAPLRDKESRVIAQLSITRDITVHKFAQEALRKAEQKYRDIFENTGEGIFQTTIDGKFLTANPAMARMFGFDTPEELIQNRTDITNQQYVDPDRRRALVELLERNELVKNFEYQAYRKDGSTIFITTTVRAVRDGNGDLQYYEGTSQDITERRRTELAMQKQTAALQKIFDHLPLMIRLTGVDGQTSLVNRNWEQTLGWKLDELRSNCAGDILDTVVPDRRERERIEDFIKTASGEWRDFKTTLRDGRSIDTSWAVVSLVDGASICIGQDITERKRADEALREAEEKYRELFENAKDAIYVHDLKGRYTSVNRAAEALSGYSRDEILGKHYIEFVAPEYVEAVRDNLCRKLVTEGETSYEVEVIGKDGCRTPVEVSSRLIRKNNVAIGVQGTARDITERRLAEEALRGYSRRLIAAQEEERHRIARELHDQIGQILTAVQFNLHAVQRSCGTPEAMARIDDGLRVLDEALEQVRDLSFDLRPSLLDDLGLVPALRWYTGRLTRRTGLKPTILTDLPYQDVRFAREVETACFRIAQEALTNVLRHSQASRVHIHLKLIKDRLLLVVGDNGIGFDAKLRAPSAMTLGLQGMQERAVAVGGSFRIISRPSIGTEVNASFPILT